MAPRDLRRTTALPQVFPQVLPQRPSRFTTALPQPLHTGGGLLLRLSCCCAAPGTHALTVRNRCHREDPIVFSKIQKEFCTVGREIRCRTVAPGFTPLFVLVAVTPSATAPLARLRPYGKACGKSMEKLPLWKTPDGKLLMEKLWNGPAKKGRCHATVVLS